MSSTYTRRTCIRGVVLHMLGGQEACTEGAMIHKTAVRRCGHKGCTSAGTDARIGSTVKARVRHVIDRGRGHMVRKARVEGVCSTVKVEKGGGWRVSEEK